MAEKKSGPVKPPTLEMQARKTSGRTPRKADAEGGTPEAGKTGPTGSGEGARGSQSSDVSRAEATEKSTDTGADTTSRVEASSETWTGAKPAESKRAESKSTEPKPVESGAAKSRSAKADSSKSSGSSGAGGGKATGAATTPATPAQRDRTFSGTSLALGAGVGALGGAVLGVGVVLFLATNGMLGDLMPEEASDLPDRVTAAEEQVSESLVGFNALDDRIGETGSEIEALGARLDEEVGPLAARQDEFAQSLDALEAETAEPVDLSPVEERLDSLAARIDAVASGADGETATALGEDLSGLRNDLDALQSEIDSIAANQEEAAGRIDSIADRTETATQELGAVAARLADVESGLAAQQAEPEMAELPLALSGLQSAMETGRPFAAELERLTTALPDLSVPETVRAAAADGLSRPDLLAENFSRAVPRIMAARPVDPDAGWADTAWSRFKSLLAVRPSGSGSGDAVETALAEAENAVAARDFAGAAAALGQLPEDMRQAAGDLVGRIETMAAAQTLLREARNAALSGPEAAPESPPAGEEAPA